MIVMISRLKETTTKNNDVMAFIVGSDEFAKWFDYFYDYTYLDRESLSIYMEEKMRYVK